MKRCPQCHRVETDAALVFCRVDGTPLLSDPVNAEAGKAKFGPGQLSMYAEAVAISEQWLQSEPANQWALRNAGFAYAKAGQRDKAEEMIVDFARSQKHNT